MGLTARVGVGMGPTVAAESGKEAYGMGMTVGVLAGMGMTEGDQQFLPLFLTSDLPVSLWRRERFTSNCTMAAIQIKSTD